LTFILRWDVILGSHDLNAFDEPHRIVASSSQGILHPDWNYNTLANDLALIKLDRPIKFNGGNTIWSLY